MKQLIALMLLIFMLVSLTGCGEEESGLLDASLPFQLPGEAPQEDAVAVPTRRPDTEAFIEPETEPTEAEIESAANPEQYYIDYCGKWESTEHYHYMELFLEGGILYLDYTCMSGNGNRIAMTAASVELSDIENNIATFTYSDDGWGNSGTLVLDFSKPDQIGATATTTYQNPSAMWSILPGYHDFVRQN